MVRRHLRNPRLVIKKTMVGRRTRTPVAVLYIDDIVDHGLVEQVNDRLNHIDIDGVFNAGMLIQNIEDKPFSPFPQVWTSERPDKTIAELLEGRIAIMVDVHLPPFPSGALYRVFPGAGGLPGSNLYKFLSQVYTLSGLFYRYFFTSSLYCPD